ncbi:MAG: hypothetical protein J4473_04035 [Candidatus Aenigmarchaeota archaeon]|nr:hypothetical protein [Candidatus Aenigmarchaeota archaeon]
MTDIKLFITKHANDKMMWLGINKGQVKRAVVFGSKFRQYDGYLARYSSICVAYKKIGQNRYLVKTVFNI